VRIIFIGAKTELAREGETMDVYTTIRKSKMKKTPPGMEA
jgi:hypothetical protein